MCSNIPFWALSFSAAYLHPRVQCSADSGVHQSPLQVLLQQVLVQVWPGARALAFLHSSGAAGAAGLDLALETTVMFQLLSVFPFSIGAPWRLGFLFCSVQHPQCVLWCRPHQRPSIHIYGKNEEKKWGQRIHFVQILLSDLTFGKPSSAILAVEGP